MDGAADTLADTTRAVRTALVFCHLSATALVFYHLRNESKTSFPDYISSFHNVIWVLK